MLHVAVKRLVFSKMRAPVRGIFDRCASEVDMQKVLCIMSATFGKLPQNKLRLLAKK